MNTEIKDDGTPATPLPEKRAPRAGTIVWGAVLVTVGVMLVISGQGFSIDPQTVAIFALAGAGVLLLTAALISGARGRKTGD